jgi:hypothetical protein
MFALAPAPQGDTERCSLQRSGTSLGPLAAAAARLHRFILCNIQHCQDKQRRARMQSARAVSQLAHARETQLNTVCQVSQVVYTNRRGLGRLQSPISSQYVGPVMLSGVEPAMGKLVSIRGSTAAASVVVQPPCSVRFSCEGQPGNGFALDDFIKTDSGQTQGES